MAKRRPFSVGLLRLLPLLVFGASLLVGASARADDPKALARTKLVEGGERLKEGEYTEALTLFKEAYDLVPSPKIFYNFGLAYQNLGRATDAVDAFERFLDEATDASPDTRANAERHRSELLPQIASVAIQCDVDGADISVDGRSKGVTPRRNPVRVDPGPHSLVVEKSPLPAFTQKIDVRAGERLTVGVNLTVAPSPGPVAPPKPEPVITTLPSPPPPPVPESPPMSWKKKLSIGLGAAAVLGLGFGAYEQLAASSKYGDFNSYAAAPNPTGKCDSDARVYPPNGGGKCPGLLSDGDSASLRAKIGFAVGGALAASSVVLFVLSRKEQPETTTSFVGCSPTGSGALCALRF